MFKRCTARARRVIRLAREAAERYRHAYRDTAHLLLGMRKDGGKDGEHRCAAGGRVYRTDPPGVARHLILLVLVLGALGIAGCYGGEDEGDEGAAGQPPVTSSSVSSVSFAVDIQPILTQSCATVGCHNAVTQAGGLNLEAGVAFSNSVGVPSRQVPSQRLIAPGDPDNSYFFRKLTGAAGIIGTRMPRDNPTFFDQNSALLALVRRWIQEGAMQH
jgi:hypothetical protein